jgi:hypothetical protein
MNSCIHACLCQERGQIIRCLRKFNEKFTKPSLYTSNTKCWACNRGRIRLLTIEDPFQEEMDVGMIPGAITQADFEAVSAIQRTNCQSNFSLLILSALTTRSNCRRQKSMLRKKLCATVLLATSAVALASTSATR